jgi:hypothetical protein
MASTVVLLALVVLAWVLAAQHSGPFIRGPVWLRFVGVIVQVCGTMAGAIIRVRSGSGVTEPLE